MKEISIRRNFIMNAFLSVSGLIFPLITYPYILRVLLPAGVGKVSIATSVVAYFSVVAQMGIPTYGVRACAKARNDRRELTRTVHELLGINLVTDGVSYCLLILALLFVPRLQEERLLYLIVSSTIFLTSIGMEWLYMGLEQYTYITIRSIVFKLIALIAMFLLVKNEKDYVIYGGISIFAASASNLVNLIHARKFVDFLRPGDCDWKKHLKPVGIFLAISCATTVYTNLDVTMLGFMKTEEDTGFYTAAVKTKGLLTAVVTSLGAVLLPRSSHYVHYGKQDDFQRMTGKALHFVFLATISLLCYFEIFAREGILFLSGPSYEESVLPMRVIMPTLVLIGLTNIMGIQILIPTNREKTLLLSVSLGAAVDLLLNAVLIPPLASTGAAVGTLAAETVVLAVQYRALRDELRQTLREIPMAPIITGAVLGSIASFWVLFLNISEFLKLMLSAVLFFGTDFLYLLRRKESLALEAVELIKRWIRKCCVNRHHHPDGRSAQ